MVVTGRYRELVWPLIAGLLVACGGDGGGGGTGPAPGPVVATVVVTPGNFTLTALNATVQFTAVAQDSSGTQIADKTFTWASSNASIATVDASGLASAQGSGTATITATTDGVSGSASVTIAQTGAGSNTLKVLADVVANDIAGGFQTTFTVTVTDAAAAAVPGATVTITNATLGAIALTETVAGSGIYDAARLQYATGDYRLSVVRATDSVVGASVPGPTAHSITQPLVNTTVTASQPLTVRWTVPVQTKAAEVETRDFGTVTAPDTGAYMIPAASNPANPSQRVRVFRYNEVDIAGGLLGSRLQVKVRSEVDPVIVQ